MVIVLNVIELTFLLERALKVEINGVKLNDQDETVILDLEMEGLQRILTGAGTDSGPPVMPTAPLNKVDKEVSAEEMLQIVASSQLLERGMVVEYLSDGEVIQRPRSEEESILPPGEPIEINHS